MRARQERDSESGRKEERQRRFMLFKLPILERCDYTCIMCGKKYPLTREGKTPRGGIQLHHILPYKIFPELEHDERNVLPLCASCHQHLHENIYMDIELMEETGRELGIDVRGEYKKRLWALLNDEKSLSL